MGTINTNKEIIKLYARQLKTPTFSNYDEIIRQLQSDDGYEEFLKEIMRTELLQRQDNLHKRRIKAAKFPIHKTIDEFDLNRLENKI